MTNITLAIEYFIFVFISSFATIQIVGSVKGKTYLRILRNQKLTIVLSAALIALSFIWFFSSGDRNVQTYIEGGQIATIFAAGSFLSIITTKLIRKIWI